MRLYFGHAGTVSREAANRLSQASAAPIFALPKLSALAFPNLEYRILRRRWSRVLSAERRRPRRRSRVAALRVVSKHGVSLSADVERRISDAHQRLCDTMPQNERLWPHLRDILLQPHAADTLRAMHSLNLLSHAVPEFEAVNLLVLRDLYHRYTVDEHTFLAIDVLHKLKTISESGSNRSLRCFPRSSIRNCFT